MGAGRADAVDLEVAAGPPREVVLVVEGQVRVALALEEQVREGLVVEAGARQTLLVDCPARFKRCWSIAAKAAMAPRPRVARPGRW